MAEKCKSESHHRRRRRGHQHTEPSRPVSFIHKLVTQPSAARTQSIESVPRTPGLRSGKDEQLSIPPTSSSSDGSHIEASRSPQIEALNTAADGAADEPVALTAQKGQLQAVEPSSDEMNESILVQSSALAEKARKLMETELLFEKLIAQSKAGLEALEEQISELGQGYVAVPRSINRPIRRRVEIPDLPPSPIKQQSTKNAQKENIGDRSFDETEENFSRVLQSTSPTKLAARPPLAPRIPFGEQTNYRSSNRLSLTKPILTNVSLRPVINN